jgi:molybdopterin synthase catalytic subunit
MILLADDPIDAAAIVQSVRSPAAGAVVLFLGTVRQETAGRQTESLDYEAFEEMARAKLNRLEEQARRRWPLLACAVVHRLGRLAVGEISVAIAVSSAHREPAFAAGQWLIDQIKKGVPIWKKENRADGSSEWVHPGLRGPSPSQADSTTSEGDENS